MEQNSSNNLLKTEMKSSLENQLKDWFQEIAARSNFSVESIPLNRSNNWYYLDGTVRHRSGRFFSIIGLSWPDNSQRNKQQPMIDQREVGTLGFAKRDRKNWKELLVYAKIEPGNMGPVQIAPTCQATASNISRALGGEIPPFSRLFTEQCGDLISDSLQSEQGSRFFHKRNRNVLINVNGNAEHSELHRWIKTDELLGLIDHDFLINTDARSVLVTGPWHELVFHKPFSKNTSGFGQELCMSMRNKSMHSGAEAAFKDILGLRCNTKKPEIIDVKDIEDCHFDESNEIFLKGREFSVRQIRVRAESREVSGWDQPIVDSHGEGRIELVCGRINGILHFAFSLQAEPGLINSAELGPTFIREPGSKTSLPKTHEGKTIIKTRQSEEGGRFFQDINNYRIIDIGEADGKLESSYWLTLHDTQELLLKGNWFTNEARSVLSLILKWL